MGSFTAETYAQGLMALAGDLIREAEDRRAAEQTRNQAVMLSIVAICFAGTAGMLTAKANAWRRDLAAAEVLRTSLYPLLRRLDDDLPYLAGTEEARRASQPHAEGAERYHRAVEILDELVDVSWARSALPGRHRQGLQEAWAHLGAADRSLTEANAVLDRAAVPLRMDPA